MSFLGPYDRELDSDEEELSFEEQFILRMPPGEDCSKLREMVAAREISPDVWFKLKGDNMYSAKLVDLPCAIEAQKTLDNKRMFKVADICQMLLIEQRISGEEIKEMIQETKSVKQGFERLLEQDGTSSTDDGLEGQTPGGHSEPGDAGTPGGGDGDERDEDGEDGEADGDIDEELAAELDRVLEGEDDDEDEDDETQRARQLLNEGSPISSSRTGNPLIRNRFEDALKKLRADLEAKIGQKDEMIVLARLRKAGEPEPDEGEPGDDAEGDDGEDAGEDVAHREEAVPFKTSNTQDLAPLALSLKGKRDPEKDARYCTPLQITVILYFQHGLKPANDSVSVCVKSRVSTTEIWLGSSSGGRSKGSTLVDAGRIRSSKRVPCSTTEQSSTTEERSASDPESSSCPLCQRETAIGCSASYRAATNFTISSWTVPDAPWAEFFQEKTLQSRAGAMRGTKFEISRDPSLITLLPCGFATSRCEPLHTDENTSSIYLVAKRLELGRAEVLHRSVGEGKSSGLEQGAVKAF
ncbi:TAFII55 protein conserved region domain containing protein [Russula decolorans]